MVQVVTYGSLEAGTRPLAPSQKRLAAARFAIVACAALATAAVVAYVSNGVPSVLYEGDPNPAHLSDDQVKGVWLNGDQAWDGIDTVLPTAGGPWQDQSDPTVGYKFKNPGSVTSDLGWTGYYDTTLRNGQEVLPGPYVNDAMGYDPTLSGTNVFWGNRGGQNVDEPAQWNHPAPQTVSQMSDGDWVPYSWAQGGPSHSSIGDGEGSGKGR